MDILSQRIYKGPLKAVILDWAGTTVDCGCCAPAGVFVEVFKRRGIEIAEAQAREPMGLHKRDHIRAITRMESVAKEWTEKNGKPCSEEDIESMFREFVPLQLDCIPRFADLTPGALEGIREFRRRNLKIGTTTGYNRDMLELLLKEASTRGYTPDSSFCAVDVPAARPAPWMIFRNAEALGVYPMEAYVKIGDTPADIEEGLNAGTWTVGVTKVGNEVGLTEEQLASIDPQELERRMEFARGRLNGAGAHYLVETLAEIGPVLDDIERRLNAGVRP
jgi:phosphonoacetaldehyde hydrolase